jgi:putative N6-adenine-specific DNA methylase
MLPKGTFRILVKTMHGLENVLIRELHELGASNLVSQRRAVSAGTNWEGVYRINLCSRLGLRVLIPIREFRAKSPDELYGIVRKMGWEQLISLRSSFAIDATVNSEYFAHSKYTALKCKDAIVDRLRHVSGDRPDVDTRRPDIRLNLHISHENVTISIDSSGESLHKRGYRKGHTQAPINEVLAAGILALAGWEGQSDFLDPMCGSGTFLIEAAMRARNIPAGIMRDRFGFMHWENYDEQMWERVKEEALGREKSFEHVIRGYDLSDIAIEKAMQNVTNALLDDEIRLGRKNFFETESLDKPYFIVTNPPYNERIPIMEKEFYKKLGNTLKFKYPGSTAFIYTASVDGIKSLGLRPSKKQTLYNGSLEGKLLKIELYAGSRKTN